MKSKIQYRRDLEKLFAQDLFIRINKPIFGEDFFSFCKELLGSELLRISFIDVIRNGVINNRITLYQKQCGSRDGNLYFGDNLYLFPDSKSKIDTYDFLDYKLKQTNKVVEF